MSVNAVKTAPAVSRGYFRGLKHGGRCTRGTEGLWRTTRGTEGSGGLPGARRLCWSTRGASVRREKGAG